MKTKFLIPFLLLPFLSFAQLKQGEFTISDDYANSVIQTSDRGYAMTGRSTANDLNIVKLDASGNMQWDKTIGGSSLSVGNSLVQTSDGGYVAAGYTTAYGAGGEDVYVVKLSSTGALLWTKTIGGPDDDWGNSIIQTKDGGYAITGATHSYGGGVPGFPDVYVIKLDANGNKVWTKTIEGPWGSDDVGSSIIQTKEGGYAVTGSDLDNVGWDKVFVFKLDSVGNLLWVNSIGGTQSDYGTSIIQSADSEYVIVGQTTSFGSGAPIYVLKLKSSGNLIWSRTIGDFNPTVGYSLVQSKDLGYVIVGLYNDSSCICKIDSAGNLLWFNYVGANVSVLYSVAQTKDAGFVATGSYSNVGMFFIKLDSLGNSCNLVHSNVYVDSGGTVTAGGIITSSDSGTMGSGGLNGTGGNITVICKVTSVEDLKTGIETIEIYPNPSNGIFSLSLSNITEKYNIEFYNVLGERVFATLKQV